MQVANSGIQKTNTIHLVDNVIIISYILTLLQYLILILNRFPYYLTIGSTNSLDPSCVPNDGDLAWNIENVTSYSSVPQYRDSCMCDIISQYDTKKINILAMSSFYITIFISIIITMCFTL